jgi:predicted DNA-binding transcriptional regulator AlpA
MAEIINPFELLANRLTNIENMLISLTDITSCSINPQKENEEDIGGISLAEHVTGLATPTIYALVSKSKIPYMKRGKKLYFSKTELIAWIRSGKNKSGSEKSFDVLAQKNKRK